MRPVEDQDRARGQGHSRLRSPVAVVRKAVGFCVGGSKTVGTRMGRPCRQDSVDMDMHMDGGGHVDTQVWESGGQDAVETNMSVI